MAASTASAPPEFVTATIGDQLFGLPIQRVHDVFVVSQMTRVPLAPKDIAGVINLRGRVLTAIDGQHRLGMPGRSNSPARHAITIDHSGEHYALLVDAVGEVVHPEIGKSEALPANADDTLKSVGCEIHRVDGEMMIVLDVDRLLDLKSAEPVTANVQSM